MTGTSRRGRRLGAGLLLVVVASAGCSYTTRSALPTTPISVESSTIHAADGTLLHTFHAEENRRVVSLDDVPRHLQDAVIAIEDERFYRHDGVDVRALARALRENTEAGEVAEGGSTITQQYVKQALLDDDSQTVERKLREASLALQLERHYSKARILELYVNNVYFGNGAYGVQAAAEEYFAKHVRDLTLAESALLAGLIQRPSATDPYARPELAVARRDVVLERMREQGLAADDAVDAALAEPLALGGDPTTPAAEQYEAAYFIEEVKQWILDDPRFGPTPADRRNLFFGGGLRIQTTVDLAAQRAAEAAAAEVLPGEDDPDVALVAIEPRTGFVRALVGGRDFFGDDDAAKVDLALRGRQTGSAFKPIVLATALAQGMSPRTAYAAPGCISIPGTNPPWRPCNYSDSGPPGVVDLVEGTVRSYNTLYAQLMQDVGPKEAVELARELGVASPLEDNPAAVLGTNAVTPVDMASAFGSFATSGVHVPPVLVTRITRSDGTVLFRHEHHEERVLASEVADTVTAILRQVVERGTATAARLDRPAAGKTGTTDDHGDAWFVGYTPELVTSVWVGFHEGSTRKMEPPTTPIRVTGGSYPARIWQQFMRAALAGRPVTDFPAPPADAFAPVPRDPQDAESLAELEAELQQEIADWYEDHPEVDPERPLPLPGRDTTTTTTSAGTPGEPGRPAPPTTRAPAPPTTTNGNLRPVPDVKGDHVDSAMAELQAAGFRVVRRAAHGSGRTGTVVAQSPAAGSLVNPGSAVTIGVIGG